MNSYWCKLKGLIPLATSYWTTGRVSKANNGRSVNTIR